MARLTGGPRPARHPAAPIIVLGLGTGLSAALRIAYVAFVARVLGPEEYGELYAALAMIFLLATGLTPIASSITRFVSFERARRDLAEVLLVGRSLVGRVGRYAAGLLLLGGLVSYPLQRVLRFGSLALPLLVFAVLAVTVLVEAPRGLLRGAERFGAYSWTLVFEAASRLAICVPLLLVFSTPEAGLVAYLLATAATLPLALWLTRPATAGRLASRSELAEMERILPPLFVFALAGAAFQNVDMLVVQRSLSPIDAGHYAAAAGMAKVVGLVFAPFGIQMLPALTAAFARGRSVGRILARGVGGFAAVSALVVAACALWGEELVQLVYGDGYEAGAPLLAPLAAALALAFISTLIGQAFVAIDSFHFLPFYCAALLAELAALGLWGSTPAGVAWIVLAAQAATLGLLVLLLALAGGGDRAVSG